MKRYSRDLDYAYAIGRYAVEELLAVRPEHARLLVLHSHAQTAAWAERLRLRAHSLGVETVFDNSLLESLRHKSNVSVLAVFDKYRTGISSTGDHVMWLGADDPGNLGATMRTMGAFGFLDLVLIGGKADVFNPHVLRASVGIAFRLNWLVLDDLDDYPLHDTRNAYRFTARQGIPVQECEFERPFTLVFGPEGRGYEEPFGLLAEPVTIPQHAEVESLNAAVAAGIGLFEAAKRHGRLARP